MPIIFDSPEQQVNTSELLDYSVYALPHRHTNIYFSYFFSFLLKVHARNERCLETVLTMVVD